MNLKTKSDKNTQDSNYHHKFQKWLLKPRMTGHKPTLLNFEGSLGKKGWEPLNVDHNICSIG